MPVVGLHPNELELVRLLVGLLRHDDPVIRELARQAVIYVESLAPTPGAEVVAC